jgi:hypothetical protein
MRIDLVPELSLHATIMSILCARTNFLPTRSRRNLFCVGSNIALFISTTVTTTPLAIKRPYKISKLALFNNVALSMSAHASTVFLHEISTASADSISVITMLA